MNGSKHISWSLLKVVTFLKRGDLDLADFKGSLHLEFSPARNFLPLFTHRTFMNLLSLSFSSYERYFDH